MLVAATPDLTHAAGDDICGVTAISVEGKHLIVIAAADADRLSLSSTPPPLDRSDRQYASAVEDGPVGLSPVVCLASSS